MSRLPRRGPGREALRAFGASPLIDRLHARVRWWTAPFPAVAAEVPAAGRILEIGCGHGLFCTYLAIAEPARNVVGVDIDSDKIAQAVEVAKNLAGGNLSFAVGMSGEVATGPWDAIAIVDMLYLLPAEAQRELLIAAAAQLAPGGLLVIKEMSPTPRWKARWNVIQETMSVSVLGITEQSAAGPGEKPDAPAAQQPQRFVFIDPAQMAHWLAELGLVTRTRRLDRHYPHPHHLLIGRRPG